ncbi:hypothetical protein NDU88_002142 [Pleurodeles waltl]|uniref:Uncharacterized protein n=1 Tax=Pleurodeles waltl TaxID=8319 RepID=A0AAV7Q914_PLEWA|nr:hypothetical protein NDU88_002142 [Pleurodeles waltl]
MLGAETQLDRGEWTKGPWTPRVSGDRRAVGRSPTGTLQIGPTALDVERELLLFYCHGRPTQQKTSSRVGGGWCGDFPLGR